MGAGGIIQQRSDIRDVVTRSSIYDILPPVCKDRVDVIATKGLADWTDDETSFMASMPTVSVHSG